MLPSDRPARVLEIGCGEGAFRSHFPAACEYWGVEPCEPAAQLASSRLSRVLTGIYEDVAGELPEGYFDLVVCNDVIEHMRDHDAFLRDIQRRMSPGARMVGSMPNVRHLDNMIELLIRKDWRYVDEGTLDRTHLRFFTARSLRRTLVEHGFGIEAFQGINPMSLRPNSRLALLRIAIVLILGGDTRFLQFAFRVRTGPA